MRFTVGEATFWVNEPNIHRERCPGIRPSGICPVTMDSCEDTPNAFCAFAKREESEMIHVVLSKDVIDRTEEKAMEIIDLLIAKAVDDDPIGKECDRILNNMANRIAMYHEGNHAEI